MPQISSLTGERPHILPSVKAVGPCAEDCVQHVPTPLGLSGCEGHGINHRRSVCWGVCPLYARFLVSPVLQGVDCSGATCLGATQWPCWLVSLCHHKMCRSSPLLGLSSLSVLHNHSFPSSTLPQLVLSTGSVTCLRGLQPQSPGRWGRTSGLVWVLAVNCRADLPAGVRRWQTTGPTYFCP